MRAPHPCRWCPGSGACNPSAPRPGACARHTHAGGYPAAAHATLAPHALVHARAAPVQVVPRQRRVVAALHEVNTTLDLLVARCRRLVESEGRAFEEEFLSESDPSILHFLVAS